MTPCPLCGLAAHTGKCERPPKGKWWCGICLLHHASGPALRPAIELIAVGAQKTDRWCTRCGTPLCDLHRKAKSAYYDKQVYRCDGVDCRARPAARIEELRALVATYNPDYCETGPRRCMVCNVPAYRNSLCQRHYVHVQSGKTELPVEYTKKPRGYKTVLKGISMPPHVAELVQRAAEGQGVSFSRWASEALERAVAEPNAVAPTIIGKYEIIRKIKPGRYPKCARRRRSRIKNTSG